MGGNTGMPISVTCPKCNYRSKFADGEAGQRVTCPSCETPLRMPGLASRAAAMARPTAPLRRAGRSLRKWTEPRWPVLCSLAWFVIGLNLAVLAPRLGLGPEAFFTLFAWVQIVCTLACIGWNVAISIVVVGRTGHVLPAWPMTLAQLLLFPLLFFQIAAFFGAGHYTWNHDPAWWDWPVFASWHAFRAFDIMDFTDAYGLRWQPIEHASVATSLLLIAFHVIVDFFFIGLLVKGVVYLKRRTVGDLDEVSIPLGGWENYLDDFVVVSLGRAVFSKIGLFIIFLAVWLTSALVVRPWRTSDLFLWPLDNVLRVSDFGDVLDIFHVRLHSVPATWWEGSLTVACRLFMTMFLVGFLAVSARNLSLRYANGWGLDEDDLEELAERHKNPEMRERAQEILEERTNQGKRPRTATVLPAGAWMIAGGVMALGTALAMGLGNWGAAVADLASIATKPEDQRAARAARGLERLGRYAAAAVPQLAAALPNLPTDQRRAVLKAMGEMGLKAAEPLGKVANGADDGDALVAVRGLQRIGAETAPLLAQATATSQHTSVQEAARQAVLDLNADAAQALIDTLSEENHAVHTALLERLDPYWHLRASSNPYFVRIQGLPKGLAALRSSQDPKQLQQAADQIGSLRGYASSAIPDLVAVLEQPVGRQSEVQESLARALGAIGAPALPAVLEHLAKPAAASKVWASIAAQEMGEAAAPATPRLIGLIDDPDEKVQLAAITALARIGPKAAAAGPALVKKLADPRPLVRDRCIAALGKIGPGAPASLNSLVPFLGGADTAVEDKAIAALLDARLPGWYLLAQFAARADKTKSSAVLKKLADKRPESAPALALGIFSANKDIQDYSRSYVVNKPNEKHNAFVPNVENLQPLVDAVTPRTAYYLVPLMDAISQDWHRLQTKNPEFAPVQAYGAALATVRNPESQPTQLLAAVRYFGKLAPGPLGEMARPALLQIMQRNQSAKKDAAASPMSQELRNELIRALDKHSLPQLIADLSNYKDHGISSPAWSKARRALETVASLGDAAAPAVPALIQLVDSRDHRLEAIRALGKIGPAALPAAPALVAQFRDSAYFGAVSDALASIGPGSVPYLMENLKDLRETDLPTRDIQAYSLRTLAKIRPPQTQILPQLHHFAANTKNLGSRGWAADCICTIHAAAGDVAGLQQLLRHPIEDVRSHAAVALKHLEGRR